VDFFRISGIREYVAAPQISGGDSVHSGQEGRERVLLRAAGPQSDG